MHNIPVWCDGCNQQGEISVKSFEDPVFVVCGNCGEETAEVWCPQCQMGGQYIRNIKKRPTSWNCSDCGTVYRLPNDFYDKPVRMSILTADQQSKLKGNLVFITMGWIFLVSALLILINNPSFIAYLFILIGIVFFAFANKVNI